MEPYLNPYRFRLWLDSLAANMLNSRQKRLLLWLLSWGKAGCDSYNYRIAQEMRCSVRTIRRDLRRLEKYHLVDVRGALGKHRRIIVLPYVTKRQWKADSFAHMVTLWEDKFVPHQRRCVTTTQSHAREQIRKLLYEPPADSESATTADGVSSRGETPRTPPAVQGGAQRMLDIARRNLVEKLIGLGWERKRAVKIADARIEQLKDQYKHGQEPKN